MDRPPDRSSAHLLKEREVVVFVPCELVQQSREYDNPEFRAEIADWFAPLGLNWRWVSVTQANVAAVVADARKRNHALEGKLVVFNLCDGDELDGYPGISVVEALERSGLCFTGADSAFYRISSSKLAMKTALARAGLTVSPFVAIAGPATDLSGVESACGYPCLLKLDVSACGLGMHRHSVVNDEATLRERVVEAFANGAAPRGILVERFIAGREFTVLVVADPESGDAPDIYPAEEVVYHPATPAEERILYQNYWVTTSPHAPPSAEYDPSADHCNYCLAPPELQQRLQDIAAQAFKAVGGRGYGRVDLRMDADGRIYVLEVNANCTLSWEDPTIGPALAARARPGGKPICDLVAAILNEAVWRHSGSLVAHSGASME